MKKFRNWILFGILVLLWSLNWTVMKNGLAYVDPLNFILHRLVLASAALFPFSLLLRHKIPKNFPAFLSLFIFGIIWTSAELAINLGLTSETSGVSAIVTYTQPLFVFCMAIPFLKEKVSANKLIGLLFGFSGVIVLSSNRLLIEKITPSFFFLLLGAFLWAVSAIFYKKFLSNIEALISSFFQLSFGAIFIGSVNLIFGNFYWPLSLNYLSIVIYSSIGTLSIALSVWLFLLRKEEATTLSSSTFIIPLVAFLFGLVVLVEPVEFQSTIGAILILIGVYFVNKQVKNS
jgi:probable blue pigment (indigoidine) exporter